MSYSPVSSIKEVMGVGIKIRNSIFLVIGGLCITSIAVIGGNALISTSEGTVKGVIIKQWKQRRCHSRKQGRSRSCRTVYKNKVELPDGDQHTFENRRWHNNRKIGDVVFLEKRKGGFFGDIYYQPAKG